MSDKPTENSDFREPKQIKIPKPDQGVEGPSTPKGYGEVRKPSTPTSPVKDEPAKNSKTEKDSFKEADGKKKELAQDNQKETHQQEEFYKEEKRTIVEDVSPTVVSPAVSPASLERLQVGHRVDPKVFEGILPSSNVTTLRNQPSLSILSVVGVLALATSYIIPVLLVRQKEKLIKKEETKRKESSCFFIRAYILRRGIELDAEVVATPNVESINREFGTNIIQFMMGRIVGILDEKTHYVLIQMFPDKMYNYNIPSNLPLTLFSPFIYLKDIKVPFWRKKPSFKKTTKFITKYLIKNYKKKIINQIKNSLVKIIERKKKV